MALKTERILIRPFVPDDWPDLFEYLSQPEVVLYEPYEVFSKEQCREEAARRATQPEFWAVCLKEDGKLIGNVYFMAQEPAEFSTWELGYVFNSRFQGCGYATEACHAILDYGFGKLEVRRVVALCNPLNTRSWKLLERLGLRREGHLRKNIFFKRDDNGSPLWNDTYEYAVLAEEWKEQYGDTQYK